MRRSPLAALLLATLPAVAACSQPDAVVGTGFQPVLDVPPEPIDALDVLFVIDDSGSMHAQQEALVAAAADSLFGALAAEAGGMPDLHVAIVSSTVPLPYQISNCGGGDGRFQTTPRRDGCAPPDGAFLVDVDDGAGGRARNFTGELADAFGCIAELGEQGCGFEHPLEAMRRALDGTHPEHAGFLRDDAMLLVVIVTDEDDCSAFDPAVFDPSDNSPLGPLGVVSSHRCFEFGVVCDPDTPREPGDKTGCAPRDDSPYLTPPSTYAAFLRGLKPDPSMVMVAGIFGDAGPVSVTWDPQRPEEPALADLCPGDEDAHPAVRLHALADAFPARWVFTPICGAGTDMAQNLRQIARTTGGVLSGRRCLLGALPARPACRAHAVDPDGARRAVDVTIAADAACAYTATGLAATPAPGALGPDDRLVVECLR